jgi:hypothetical protein
MVDGFTVTNPVIRLSARVWQFAAIAVRRLLEKTAREIGLQEYL